jgi:hypothetical protein
MAGSRYVKTPEPNEEIRPLYEAVLKVLSGAMTATDAAQSVALSRERFKSRMNRGLSGLLDSLADQPRGPKPTPESEQALRAEVERLEKENEELVRQLEALSRMMGATADYVRKGMQKATRRQRSKPSAESAMSESDDDGPARALAVVNELTASGVPARLACAAAGITGATARRWKQRQGDGAPMRRRRGPRPEVIVPLEAKARAEEVLDAAHGCIGAAPLAVASGLSRRTAAAVKAEHLTRKEHERRSEAVRVSVVPGVIRGFDAMDVKGVPVLVSAEAGMPYRTSICVVESYDSASVAATVARDFALNGAPLVWRVDRWKAHETEEVLKVLAEHQVLLLHGPPRHPCFYGQLERQNREQRAWFDAMAPGTCLRTACESMREAFNELVPRRTLGWLTAGQAWRARAPVMVDRGELKLDVEERVRKLREQEALRVAYPGLIERLAIQGALIDRGLLRLTKGGWC